MTIETLVGKEAESNQLKQFPPGEVLPLLLPSGAGTTVDLNARDVIANRRLLTNDIYATGPGGIDVEPGVGQPVTIGNPGENPWTVDADGNVTAKSIAGRGSVGERIILASQFPGVTGNGTTNDITPLQNMLDVANTKGGVRVKIDVPMAVDAGATTGLVHSNTTVERVAGGDLIQMPNGSGYPVLRNANPRIYGQPQVDKNIIYLNLRVNHNRLNNGMGTDDEVNFPYAHALEDGLRFVVPTLALYGAKDSKVIGCRVDDQCSYGLHIGNGQGIVVFDFGAFRRAGDDGIGNDIVHVHSSDDVILYGLRGNSNDDGVFIGGTDGNDLDGAIVTFRPGTIGAGRCTRIRGRDWNFEQAHGIIRFCMASYATRVDDVTLDGASVVFPAGGGQGFILDTLGVTPDNYSFGAWIDRVRVEKARMNGTGDGVSINFTYAPGVLGFRDLDVESSGRTYGAGGSALVGRVEMLNCRHNGQTRPPVVHLSDWIGDVVTKPEPTAATLFSHLLLGHADGTALDNLVSDNGIAWLPDTVGAAQHKVSALGRTYLAGGDSWNPIAAAGQPVDKQYFEVLFGIIRDSALSSGQMTSMTLFALSNLSNYVNFMFAADGLYLSSNAGVLQGPAALPGLGTMLWIKNQISFGLANACTVRILGSTDGAVNYTQLLADTTFTATIAPKVGLYSVKGAGSAWGPTTGHHFTSPVIKQ